MLAGAAAATALVAFALGFGLAAIGREPEARESGAAPTTVAPPTTSASSTTTSTTVAIAPAPSFEAPTTTLAPTTTTEPPTTVTQPVTAPPTSAAPAFVTVEYASSGGQILLRAGATTQIRFTNVGGGIGQWSIQGASSVFVVGPTNGTLTADQSRFVTIQAAPEVSSGGVSQVVTVAASGTGTLSIPVRVVN